MKIPSSCPTRPMLTAVAMGVMAALSSAQPAAQPPVGGEPPAVAEKPQPPAEVEKLGDGRFKLGLIHFESESREIRIPAKVNMQQGMIEFPLTHVNGRTHEAIFTTEALPLHLEFVLRLLRYEPSQEVFPTFPGVDPKNPPPWEEWPEPVFSPAKPASHLQVLVSWEGEKAPKEPIDIRSLLYRSKTDPEGQEPEVRFEKLAPHWVFTGSTEKMGTTVESLGGAMVGIRTESECSINTVSDEVVHELEWFADPKSVPAPGTPVTIHIRPVHPAARATAPATPATTPNPAANPAPKP